MKQGSNGFSRSKSLSTISTASEREFFFSGKFRESGDGSRKKGKSFFNFD
jgi:hypothetical protein